MDELMYTRTAMGERTNRVREEASVHSVVCRTDDRVIHLQLIRQIELFEGERKRRVSPGDARNGRFQVVKTFILDGCGDLAGKATSQRRLVSHEQPPCLLNRCSDGVHVPWRYRSQVDRLARDAVGLGPRASLCHHMHLCPPRHAGDVFARGQNIRLSKREFVISHRYLAHRCSVQYLGLEEYNRIFVANGSQQKPLCSICVSRVNDLQPRSVRKVRLGRLRVIVTAVANCARRCPDC
mmetsp:Transcript_39127/g.64943  ORF Transcript_39127/g.64943 Transcript_39127/m.64943 type:complete len:238 (+) Transcript_39127:152-865(+)